MHSLVPYVVLLGSIFISHLTLAEDNSHLMAEYHLNARELVTMDITAADGSTVSIDAPFMQIEIQHDVYHGSQPLSATSAHITSSTVANFDLADITCILFDKNLHPINAAIKSSSVDIRTNGQPTEIHAVGCGTHKSLLGDGAESMPVVQERDGRLCNFLESVDCFFTAGIFCAVQDCHLLGDG
ncbi:MAG: hypothetical protein Q9227_007056 [Pyrenula ochraceoflavens]